MGAGLFALSQSSTATAAPTTVKVPEDQPTIQAGVDAVASGGTVEVSAGTYEESVQVGKPVTIVGDPGDEQPGPGQNAPVLDGNSSVRTSGIELHRNGNDPDDVTIRGLVLRDYGLQPDDGQWGHGVAAGRANDGITVEDCRVEDVGAAGVSVSGPGENQYRNWTVKRCQFVGAPLAGVRFDHVSDALIANNEFITPDGFENYPRFGVYIHANTDAGHSSTQEHVTIEGNRFEGDSGRAAVWLLAINKNDPDEGTHATLQDVTVAGNEFDAMPDNAAIAAAANSINGGTTRLQALTVSDNTVRRARSGVTVDSGAVDGVSDVTISNNDVRESDFGVKVSGRKPASLNALDVRDNVVDTDIVGLMVANHQRDAAGGDNRYTIDDITVVGGEYEGGSEWGVAFNAAEPHGIGSVTVQDVAATGKEGLHANGESADAFAEITVSGGRFESTEGAGLHVGGATDAASDTPALGSASLDGVEVHGEGPGIAVTADSQYAVGPVAITNSTAQGQAGIYVRAQGAGALEQINVAGTTLHATDPGIALNGRGGTQDAPSLARATLEDVTVQSGQGFQLSGAAPNSIGQVTGTNLTSNGKAGLRVIGRAPGAIQTVDVDGLTAMDATEGPGLDVTGRPGDAPTDGSRPYIDTVTVSNADITGREAGVTLLGRAAGALGDIDLNSFTVDTTDAPEHGPGILINGDAADAVSSVSITGADISGKEHAIMVNGRTADAGLSLEVDQSTVTSDDGGGVVVHGGADGSVDTVELSSVVVERSRWNGLRVHGVAPGAVGSVNGTDVTVASARGPGIQVVGEHPGTEATSPAVGAVDLDGFDVTTEATPETEDGRDGVVVRGQDDATVGSVSLRNGTVDADFIGVSTAAERNGRITALSLESVDVSSGAAGVEVAAHGDATLSSASLTDLTIRPGWAGVQVHGREGGRVADVVGTGLDVAANGGPGLLVTGRSTGAVGDVIFEDSRFQSSVFLGNRVQSPVSGGVESVDLRGCDLSDSHTGLFVWGKAADAVETIGIESSEIRDNNYGVIVAGPEKSAQSGDAVTIRQTNIVGNNFEVDGKTRGYGVFNLGAGRVDARRNYWGHPSGPAYPRPGKSPATTPTGETPEAVLENYPRHADFIGQGDRVSDGVRYEPYLKQPA